MLTAAGILLRTFISDPRAKMVVKAPEGSQ